MATDLGALLGGGGISSYYALGQQWITMQSTTFTPPVTGYYRVTCIGGGGSGANVTTTFEIAGVQGGGAGGFVQKIILLSSGTTYTVTVGAGGAGRSASGAGGNLSGIAGGATSFSGSGITTISASGGARGLRTASNPTAQGTLTVTAQTRAGGSGGDIINEGGISGTISWFHNTGSISQVYMATGGGAVNIHGIPPANCDSGFAINSGNTDVASIFALTGGGGVGGTGGNINVTSGTNVATTYTGGGGSSKSALGITNPTSITRSAGGEGMETFGSVSYDIFRPYGKGSAASYNAVPSPAAGPGAGGGSRDEFNAGGAAGDGGIFGGGGAMEGTMGTGNTRYAGNGGLGGGGGGIVGQSGGSAGTSISGAGGNGLIVIEPLLESD